MWKHSEVAQLIASSVHLISRMGITIKASPASACSRQGRLVVVVPKRIGSAPLRNRNKRRIRAVFMHLQKQHSFCQFPMDFVVFVRRSIATVPYLQLLTTFEEAYAALNAFSLPTP